MNTSAALPRRSWAHLRITLVMLFLGVVMLVSSGDFLREWSALQPALAVVTAIWALAGIVAAGCSLWLLFRRDARPLWTGAAAAVVAGVNLGIGVLLHIVPCPGPTCVSRLIVAGGLIFFGIIAPIFERR